MPDHTQRIFNILTLNNISSIGLKRFPSDHYYVSSELSNPDAILVRSHNMLDMNIPGSVIAIGRAGAGTNNIPINEMSLRGVPVFNTPGANANAVKELVLAGMLIASRNLIPAFRFVESLHGDDQALHKQVEDHKKKFLGMELPKRTLGIIGLGKIGRLVADAAIKLGMKVLGYDPKITVDSAWSLSSEVQKAQSIEDLLRHSDFISLHVPLMDSTYHLINDEVIQFLKRNTILLNFSRDTIVDEDAVLTGIKNGKIKYYVCDFPSQKLQHHESVIALPHLGASTQEAEENCAIMVVDQMMNYLQHGNIINTVNFPNIVMERGSHYRIAVANANVPNLLGQISTCMAKAGLNIHNMTNKSRGEMAYTLVDIDSPVPEYVIGDLSKITGVLLVRYLPIPTETSD
ncbi:phosphoglycerate dehydrogenase [Nitrosomonas sp. Nm58]|uniref:phosphoglycerate dehydrogenase n=1 Tax=Nitrosomonas sp. Nm58 TaxID=200126 RepID=UPI000897FC75|nr:phosphoglycerate dehydrogenase [Nitrosomonas sp. Nm58]SDY91023.1 D-3-phosphoglycerate dehydrogenase [Nitrosomonas sp. Nm58]